MPLQPTSSDRVMVSRALEVSINVGLAILLAVACLLILRIASHNGRCTHVG